MSRPVRCLKAANSRRQHWLAGGSFRPKSDSMAIGTCRRLGTVIPHSSARDAVCAAMISAVCRVDALSTLA